MFISDRREIPARREFLCTPLRKRFVHLTHQRLHDTQFAFQKGSRYGRETTLWMERSYAFGFLSATLSEKTTTKAEDTLHILVNLIGLSAAEVGTFAPIERTKAVFRTLPAIPLDLLLLKIPRAYMASGVGPFCPVADR